MERAITYKNNLGVLRTAIEETPELGPAVQESVSPVITLLNQRFSRMKLKGNPVQVRTAATQDEIVDNFESVHFIDNSLKMGALSQATLKDAKDLQAFMSTHCSSTHYLFQIKKCGMESCQYCLHHPVRLPPSVFELLKFVPLPLMNMARDHYKTYEGNFHLRWTGHLWQLQHVQMLKKPTSKTRNC